MTVQILLLPNEAFWTRGVGREGIRSLDSRCGDLTVDVMYKCINRETWMELSYSERFFILFFYSVKISIIEF